ncbi:GGDEF domain-containing protein [Tissierella creatinophila]|uniref:Diguanylate cyclase DosC n=1 Tax=Tissierella creatinophila DSM 6911 TaxID=1123403 RepID=A0A1U7M3R5_TISCR|nr:GGDEF domain-containing protein [Tissierella creatinophila]OLS01925.1 diguanylate cyclase DosC [Tissierella creatinophila DSM 6911]
MAGNSKINRTPDLDISRQVFAKRVVLILITFVLLSVVIIVLFIYRPLKVELEKSLVNSFQELANIRYISLENNINKGLEGARSMSSRSVIRDSILDYMDKEITLEELKVSNQKKYEDGAKVLDNLILAERYVEDNLIASYPVDNYEKIDCGSWVNLDKNSQISYEICLEERNEYLKVLSTIYAEDKIIGYDMLLFNLKEQIHNLCTDEIKSEIISQEEMANIIKDAKILKSNGSNILLYNGGDFYKAFHMKDTNSLIVRQGKEHLLEPIYRTGSHVLFITIGVLIVYTLGIYFFIIRYAKNELDNSCIDLNVAINKANTDPLTNLCSRRCGEEFLILEFEAFKRNRDSPAIFVIDIDGLKKINDEHGHLVGDLAIQAVSKKLEDSIRHEDIIFRWGGDEFIGIFHRISEENSLKLAQKLLAEISSLEITADKGIIRPTISIGISYFFDEDYAYIEVINRADNAMYQSKLKGKNKVNMM